MREVAKPRPSYTPREPDAIYQKDRPVARVMEPEIDEEAKQIHFAELYRSDSLLLPDQCEFQKYLIVLDRIAYATKLDGAAPHKGRILRGVTARIVGYREN